MTINETTNLPTDDHDAAQRSSVAEQHERDAPTSCSSSRFSWIATRQLDLQSNSVTRALIPRTVTSMTGGVFRLRQEQADCLNSATVTQRSRVSPWRTTSRVTRTQSLIHPAVEHRSNWTPAWPRQRRPGKTIVTIVLPGREQRMLRSEGVLSSGSADHRHVTARWIDRGVCGMPSTLPPQRRCSRDQHDHPTTPQLRTGCGFTRAAFGGTPTEHRVHHGEEVEGGSTRRTHDPQDVQTTHMHL